MEPPITSYSLDGQRMTVTLPQPLQAGSATTFAFNFKLNIPQKTSEEVFGYDFNQINLVDWYPFIVPYQGGWVLHDPMPWGEHLVYDASDIELNIKKDADVIIAAGATPDRNGEWTRYRMYGARTFAFSASDEFLVSEVNHGECGCAFVLFQWLQNWRRRHSAFSYARRLKLFRRNSLPIRIRPSPSSKRICTTAWNMTGWFSSPRIFTANTRGGARGNLATIGVHEIAHQWWFGLVGSDQAHRTLAG